VRFKALKTTIESFESRKGDLGKKLQDHQELEDLVNSARQASKVNSADRSLILEGGQQTLE
jgi:hypothetical protein